MDKINTESLISAVQSRPVLWEDTQKAYKNKNVTDKEWKEVGQIFNCSDFVSNITHPSSTICTFSSHNLPQRKSINIGLSETAILDIMAANLQQQRAINEQLQREAGIPRMLVSEASTLMIKYVSEHENEDCLLSGFSSQKVNPFREKSSCRIL